MSEAGFVKVYRALLGHPAFRNDAEAMAFAWMVIRASWKPARVRYKDKVLNLNRGQLAMSVRDMAAAMDRDKAWIERLWKRLKSETMIETATDAGVSIVTICNYDVFQGERDTSETVRETPSETGARQAQDTEQRREEDKNTSEDKSSSVVIPRGKPHRIPANWEPSPLPETVASLVAQWPPGREVRELDGFRDYWAARSRDAARIDWDKVWHNRIRDQHDRVLRENWNGNDRQSSANRHHRGDGFLNACREAADRQAGYPPARNDGRSAGAQGLGGKH